MAARSPFTGLPHGQLLLRAGLELLAVIRLRQILAAPLRSTFHPPHGALRRARRMPTAIATAIAATAADTAATVQVFAEDGDQATFDRKPAGHRKPAGLRPAARRKRSDDFEQMSRVGGRPHAARQNQIVARSFTFHAKTPGGEPHQRIEPVQSTRDLHEQLSDRVATLHVGELVQQNRSQLFATPMPAAAGSNRWHRRMPQTTGIVLSG